MSAEKWVCRYEIRDDGVYLDGTKVGDREADELVARFDHEQRLFTGIKEHPRIFQTLRRIKEKVTN